MWKIDDFLTIRNLTDNSSVKVYEKNDAFKNKALILPTFRKISPRSSSAGGYFAIIVGDSPYFKYNLFRCNFEESMFSLDSSGDIEGGIYCSRRLNTYVIKHNGLYLAIFTKSND